MVAASSLRKHLSALCWAVVFLIHRGTAIYGVEGQNGTCDCPEDSVGVIADGNTCVCLPRDAPEAEAEVSWKQPRMKDLKEAHGIFAKWREVYGGVHKADDPSPDGVEENPTKELVVERWEQFNRKLKQVAAHNDRFDQGEESFSVSLNGMADLRDEERTRFYLGTRPTHHFGKDHAHHPKAHRRRAETLVGYPVLTEAELEMTPEEYLQHHQKRADQASRRLAEETNRRVEEGEDEAQAAAPWFSASDFSLDTRFFRDHGQWVKEYTKERDSGASKTRNAAVMAKWQFPIRHDLLPTKPRKRVDWRKYDTPVRRQRECGSCWAHASLAGLENHLRRNGWPNVHLSVQELIDCGSTIDSCEAGWYEYQGMEYASVFGVTTESRYPYENRNHICRRTNKHRYIPPGTYQHVQMPTGEYNLARAVSLGATVIRMWIPDDFMDYAGGIYDKYYCNDQTTTGAHAMLIVGFTETAWIIKNSWDDDWGINGYGYVRRGNTNTWGVCDIAERATFLTDVKRPGKNVFPPPTPRPTPNTPSPPRNNGGSNIRGPVGYNFPILNAIVDLFTGWLSSSPGPMHRKYMEDLACKSSPDRGAAVEWSHGLDENWAHVGFWGSERTADSDGGKGIVLSLMTSRRATDVATGVVLDALVTRKGECPPSYTSKCTWFGGDNLSQSGLAGNRMLCVKYGRLPSCKSSFYMMGVGESCKVSDIITSMDDCLAAQSALSLTADSPLIVDEKRRLQAGCTWGVGTSYDGADLIYNELDFFTGRPDPNRQPLCSKRGVSDVALKVVERRRQRRSEHTGPTNHRGVGNWVVEESGGLDLAARVTSSRKRKRRMELYVQKEACVEEVQHETPAANTNTNSETDISHV